MAPATIMKDFEIVVIQELVALSDLYMLTDLETEC